MAGKRNKDSLLPMENNTLTLGFPQGVGDTRDFFFFFFPNVDKPNLFHQAN